MRFWLSIAAVGFFAGVLPSAVGAAEEPKRVDFAREVAPIFAARCYECHGSERQESEFRLDLGEAALRGGAGGEAIVPGKSAESPLIERVTSDDEDMRMPPEGKPLSAEQIAVLRAWIDQGASWPNKGVPAVPAKEQYWALAPLAPAGVPSPQGKAWPRGTIDAFLLAKLEENKMQPAAPAARRTLIRRLSFDLAGLPPTPDEVAEFEADRSPDAVERVVDRLLSSPRFGERWARHWMDVIHFAETHGNDQDRPRPNAWPYRDWLIRSFNEDKPYAKFVAEQIAGDVLFPDDPHATPALGFLSAGPWDESSLMCIVDDTTDKMLAQVLDRDDMVTTVMSTFTSTTVHCARCHNHKFDPISQADYYALQAVFAGVDRVDRPYDADREVFLKRRALLAEKALIATTPAAKLLADPARSALVAQLERDLPKDADVWLVVDATSQRSAAGTPVTKQSDGSLLFSGTPPEKDTYTIEAAPGVAGITAIRLELLTDASLPREGPGRAPNGNLHLSEFKVTVTSADGKSSPVRFKSAVADFDQQGYPVAAAIDDNPKSAWGIFPEVTKSHSAVFELAEPIAAADAKLTFVLEQTHGGSHLIGRPRLAVTRSARPQNALPLLPSAARILAKPAGERTAAEQEELGIALLSRRVDRELAALPAPRNVFAVSSTFAQTANFKPAIMPRPVHVLRRGDIRQPIAEATPGALSCLPDLKPRFATPAEEEGARRAALARWLTDRGNVLVWRSIANRLWHYHYGRGIVDTPNDLGKMGGRPTHGGLLDHLAIALRDGATLKQMHRRLVTTAAYQQSSAHNAEFAKLDADNRLLWRMNRTRLDAESIRDAVLAVSGKLDLAMGGPSVKQFVQTPGVHVTPVVDYQAYDVDDPGNFRRSVYRFLFRTLPDPFMESMDCPDASQHAPVRTTSVTALQALAMLNNRLMVRQSEHVAGRLERLSGDPAERIRLLYQWSLARDATPDEVRLLTAHAGQFGLANVCRIIINSNEFMFVD